MDDGNSGKFEIFGCSIEEGLEKVSLVGNVRGCLVVIINDMKEKGIVIVGDGNDFDSDLELGFGFEIFFSLFLESFFSSEIDDDEEEKDEEKLCNIKNNNIKSKVDIEEGEIMGFDLEKMVFWSENDDDGDDNYDDRDGEDYEVGEVDVEFDDEDNIDLFKGFIKLKNELTVNIFFIYVFIGFIDLCYVLFCVCFNFFIFFFNVGCLFRIVVLCF